MASITMPAPAAFADGLAAASRSGTFSVVSDTAGEEALGLSAGVGTAGKLVAKVIRTGGPQREGAVHAYSARGQRLGETPFRFARRRNVHMRSPSIFRSS